MKEETKRGLLLVNLQYFAEKGGGEGGTGEQGTPGEDGPAPADLNALLAGEPALQSQFDRLVTKALGTARAKWQREQTMTATELVSQQQQEREAHLAEREQALALRELRAQALSALGERSLPLELGDCLDYTDQAQLEKSLGRAERAFRSAVDQAVAQRMSGPIPKGGEGGSTHALQVRQAMGLK